MLNGLGGLGDMAKMMKTAQEMQGKMTHCRMIWQIFRSQAKAAPGW